jgi:hypothetical protein
MKLYKKCIICQFDVGVPFLQAKMRNRVFIKLPKLYGEIFPEYQAYWSRPARLRNSMEIMTLTGKYLDKEFRDWIISVGFIQSPTSPVLFAITEPDGIMLRIIFHTALMMDYMLVHQKELLTCLKINYQQDSM